MDVLSILEMPKMMAKANNNLRYFIDNYIILTQKFPNKFVAIDNEDIIDNDHNLKELLKRLESMNNYSNSTIIQFIDTTNVKLTI